MQFNRQIIISTAGSRKATKWPPSTLWWSELTERLRVPTRGVETLAAYMAMPKSKQDDLKDVGGFVAGTLQGNRRKAKAVTGRDVVTIDADTIPAGGTDDVLRRVEGLGCGYCVYSTRKHEGGRPRLRILLPLSRTCTADEYEPIARKLAALIGIELCDPTTFEASRLMYYPSCCADSQYIHVVGDKPFVDTDGVLAMYHDWHNVAEWPQVPGVDQTQQRLAAKQGDPTSKAGVVGAFCRTYDIYRAMEEIIPDAYMPTDIPDRYTYAGGSTTGGAVVYDHGQFLYSHHATDPCSNKLVNAFDLVRLHKFSDQDDDALPGTPVHKLGSYIAMQRFALSLTEVAALHAQERGKVVLEIFGDTQEGTDSEQAQRLGELADGTMTTPLVRKTLAILGMSIRNNEILGRAEVTGYPKEWSAENAENNLPVYLLDVLRTAGVTGAYKSALCDQLDVIADECRYNPVLEMFRAREWDGQDRVNDIFGIWKLTDPFSQLLIRKWLIQCVAMAHNSLAHSISADGVLVLNGPQGIGKTSSLRQLVPNPIWFKEGADIDPRNKDSIIQATQHWICELGELERTTRRDQAALKAFITAASDQFRTPYARKAIARPRRTSFCGTVNREDFLVDDTGNRRYWTVSVQSMDLTALFSLDFEWKLQLWAQMYVAYLKCSNAYRLTKEEREQLEAVNQNYDTPLNCELEVRNLLNFQLPVNQWGTYKAAEIAEMLLSKPDARSVGKVLTKLAKEDPRIKKLNREASGQPYLVPLLPRFPPTPMQ